MLILGEGRRPSLRVNPVTSLHRIRSVWQAGNAPIHLVPAAAQPNVGDELITRTRLGRLARHAPDREVWLDSIEPGRATHLFADAHPRLRVTDTLWRIAQTMLPQGVPAAAARREESLIDLGSRAITPA